MVSVSDYIMGDFLSPDLVLSVAPEKRFVVFTAKNYFKQTTVERTGEKLNRPTALVVFNGKPIEWSLSKTAARLISRQLGTEMDLWKDCQADLDVKTNGAISFIIPKNVYKSEGLAFSDGTVKRR